MKMFLAISLFFFPFFSNANVSSLEPGLYHLEWAYGPNDNYKIIAGVVGDVDKVDGFYYLKNKIDDQSNDEVYILINKGSGTVFFKHEEIEGGPTIGWANIQLNDKAILIDTPTTKNFYDNTDGDSDRDIKYKVGFKFPGSKKAENISEIAPMEILKNNVFKVDCSEYFKSNKEPGGKEKKNDPMQDYSSSVLLSDNGLCNSIINKNNKTEVLKGWMLFRRIS